MQRWYNKFYQDNEEFYRDKKEWSQRTATERSRWSGMDHSADAVGHKANVTCHTRKMIGHLSGHLTGHWTGITTLCSDWTSTCPSCYVWDMKPDTMERRRVRNRIWWRRAPMTYRHCTRHATPSAGKCYFHKRMGTRLQQPLLASRRTQNLALSIVYISSLDLYINFYTTKIPHEAQPPTYCRPNWSKVGLP